MACSCITESTWEMAVPAHYLEGREILRSPLDAFAGDQPLTVVQHEGAPAVGVTLRRAMGGIGEQHYNFLFNSCEYFANWCKTGRHRSRQVEDWLGSGDGPVKQADPLR